MADVSRTGVPFRSGPPAVQPGHLPIVPPPLVALLGGTAEQVWVKPGSEVWRITDADTVRYLKGTDPDWSGRVEAIEEAERLGWATTVDLPVAVPDLLGATTDEPGRGWIVTAAVPGIPAHEPLHLVPTPAGLIEALGTGLRRLHDRPVAGCPFESGAGALLESAAHRVEAGAVDPSTMGATYQRATAPELLAHLLATRPADPADADLVVAHGDPTQPNLLVDPLHPDGPTLVAMVDVGRLGVSDRYRDLAIVTRSLLMNLGPEVVFRFFDAYGLPNPDLARLEWYALIDDMW